jgi:hypothetical protein
VIPASEQWFTRFTTTMNEPYRCTIAGSALPAGTLLLLLICACAVAPPRVPNEVPAPPVVEMPEPVRPRASSWALHTELNTIQYQVQTEATVELAPSAEQSLSPSTPATTPPGSVPVRTTALVTMTLTPDGDSVRVIGTVDSFTVTRGQRIPIPPDSTIPRTDFSATLRADGRVSSFSGPPTPGCNRPLEPLLSIARDVLLATPSTLAVGQMWRDSSTIATCRGPIEFNATIVREYRVEGPDVHGDTPAIRLSRLTTTTLEGSGTDYGRMLTLTGSSHARSTLYVDSNTGVLLAGTTDSDATFTIGTAREQTPFRQVVQQKIIWRTPR